MFGYFYSTIFIPDIYIYIYLIPVHENLFLYIICDELGKVYSLNWVD